MNSILEQSFKKKIYKYPHIKLIFAESILHGRFEEIKRFSDGLNIDVTKLSYNDAICLRNRLNEEHRLIADFLGDIFKVPATHEEKDSLSYKIEKYILAVKRIPGVYRLFKELMDRKQFYDGGYFELEALAQFVPFLADVQVKVKNNIGKDFDFKGIFGNIVINFEVKTLREHKKYTDGMENAKILRTELGPIKFYRFKQPRPERIVGVIKKALCQFPNNGCNLLILVSACPLEEPICSVEKALKEVVKKENREQMSKLSGIIFYYSGFYSSQLRRSVFINNFQRGNLEKVIQKMMRGLQSV